MKVYRNLLAAQRLYASSEAAGFAKENVLDPRLSKQWRSYQTERVWTKLPALASPPTSGQMASAWSNDGVYLATCGAGVAPLLIYKRAGETMTRITAIDTPPTGTGRALAWSSDGTYLACAHDTSPYVTIYKRTGDTFAKLANPADLPAGNGKGISFSSDDTYLAVAHTAAPYITIYKRAADVFAKLADPATTPTGDGYASAFSSDTIYLSVSHATSPFVTIYKRAADVFAKLADPGSLPASTGYSAAWTRDTTYLVIGHNVSPFVTIYKRAADVFTKLTNPADLPASTVTGACFNADGSTLVLGHLVWPYITLYNRSTDTFTKLASPDVVPSFGAGAQGGTASIKRGEEILAFAASSSPYLLLYAHAEWIKVDAGDGLTITADTAAILGHNLTASALVRVQANALDRWDAPSLDSGYAFVEADEPVIQGFASATYRYWRFLVRDYALRTQVEFMDRGDCESATPPMVSGETVPVTLNASGARDLTDFDTGTSSFKITKTVAAGTVGNYYFVDSNDTMDMHGFVPGTHVDLRFRMKIPSALLVNTDLVFIFLQYVGGAWVASQVAPAAAYDTYLTSDLSVDINGAATGVRFLLQFATTGDNNDYVNIDNVSCLVDGELAPIQIGGLMLAAVEDLEDIDAGMTRAREDTDVVSRSVTGQVYADLGEQLRVYELSMGTMADETREALEDLFALVGRHTPILVRPTDDAQTPPLYCVMDKAPKFTQAGGWLWRDDTFRFVEAK